ncbi:MAG: nucleoside-diphosphate sugar epimerase/dehydratase [Paracoccaceae bacterium]
MLTMISRLSNLDRVVKRAIQAIVDSVLIVACYDLAMTLRLEDQYFVTLMGVWVVLAVTLPLSIAVFAVLGLYRAALRYINSQVATSMAIGVFASSVIMLSVVIYSGAPVPRSVPIIYGALLFIAMGASRFVYRAVIRFEGSRAKEPVIVYGAGEAGRQLAQALLQGPDYSPVAFLDDSPQLQGLVLMGRKVHPPSDAKMLAQTRNARVILFAIPSATRAERRAAIDRVTLPGVEIKTMPGIADLVNGRATLSELRTVTPEDLLGRDPVPPLDGLMAANIRGKAVLVSGAGGSIGSELCRQIMRYQPRKLVLLDVSEFALYSIDTELRGRSEAADLELIPILGSVQNPNRMRAIIERMGIQTIYHAAAYKHVPLVEYNIAEGVRNNVFGTRTLARAAADHGVEAFILISTDKAVRPTNVMGTTKRIAELICQAEAKRSPGTVFSMVRFGNVLGSSGSVIPRFKEQIAAGGPITVTHPDITRYFMTIPEAAQLVIQAGAMASPGDVFLLDMGEPVKILDLARTIARLHGLTPFVAGEPEAENGDIEIRFTGLRPGEKLYEELLVGENSQRTSHPYISKENIPALEPAALDAFLERLWASCVNVDIEAIWAVLQEMPTEFHPTGSANDLLWNAKLPAPNAQTRKIH